MNFYSINFVFLVGYVASKKDLQTTKPSPGWKGNRKLVRFQLATRQVFAANNTPRVSYHNCHAWGTRADFVDKHLKPGDFIAITGTLGYYVIAKEEGQRRVDYVNVEEITFLPSGRGQDGPAPEDPGEAGEDPAGEGDSLPPGGKDPIEGGNPFL